MPRPGPSERLVHAPKAETGRLGAGLPRTKIDCSPPPPPPPPGWLRLVGGRPSQAWRHRNSDLEEVHAATPQHACDVFTLQDLEQVVTDARYTQGKVFVNDLRTADESLLSNKEVVDNTLIDAPGLNHDTTHTTAVFARQEEIDVVVFVVSATNHFTKRDSLARQVDISIELQDFIDWQPLVSTGKFANAGMALTLATAVGGRLADLHGWLNPALMLARVVDNNSFRRLLVPGVLIAVIAATMAHILQQIPHAVPRRCAKYSGPRLRVSGVCLDRSVRDLEQRRDDMDKLHNDSHAALRYFGNLVRASTAEQNTVKEINLEAPPAC
ncbi:GTPase FZO1 [Hirsutella rhossiliensis]